MSFIGCKPRASTCSSVLLRHHTTFKVESISSYEWEMKNFSSHFPPQRQNSAPLISGQIQEGEERQDINQQRALNDKQEEKARCEWDFTLSTVISSSAVGANISDAIGVVEFDQEDRFLATGGIARKIRIYTLGKLLKSRENGERGVTARLDHEAASEFYMCAPAKLSSLKWKPGSGSLVIGSGDYDGVVMEYDLEKRVPVFERDEHGGRRIWSIDYSHRDPNLGASGSDDGTMQMWDPRCDGGGCLASVRPNQSACSPVCCVEFNAFGGPLVAVGCADGRIYGYDVRRLVSPVFVLDGHQKAVTYARFLDLQTIVSSSIDECLMKWNTEDRRLIRTYRGHVNSRRFVGLSVWRNGGLLSCGSENNKVFVYDKRWGQPIWVGDCEQAAQPRGGEPGFVSAVCWRRTGEERCMLVAGGSDGVLQVFEVESKPCS